tara:strand:- start:302 stop:703 length:402 start_codon:yes stop_codon:yes gene_type:complete
MRSGSFFAIQQFMNATQGTKVPLKGGEYSKKNKKTKLGLGEIVCWIARVVGCVMFLVSFGAFALPTIGFTWAEALIVFSVGLVLSQAMMNFYQVYYEFVGTVTLLWSKFKKEKSLHEWLYNKSPQPQTEQEEA